MSLGLWGPSEAEWKSTLSYYQLSPLLSQPRGVSQAASVASRTPKSNAHQHLCWDPGEFHSKTPSMNEGERFRARATEHLRILRYEPRRTSHP